MLPRSIELGPLSIHLYGFTIALSIVAGLLLAKRRAKHYKIPERLFDSPILLIPLILSVIGARIYHVLDYWQFYKEEPMTILYLTNGGLGIFGALFGLVFGLFFIAKLKNLNIMNVLDLAAPSILLGQAIGRIGNFINQEGFGPPTNMPWGVFIKAENRPVEFISSSYFHPTFFYEAILNLFFFLILIKISFKLKKKGQVFALYLIFYSLSRFIIEFWRIDTWTIGTIQMAHVFSLILFVSGMWFYRTRKTTIT